MFEKKEKYKLMNTRKEFCDVRKCNRMSKEVEELRSFVSLSSEENDNDIMGVTVLRDTAITRSMILECILPAGCSFMEEEEMVAFRGLPDNWTTSSSVELWLDSSLVKSPWLRQMIWPRERFGPIPYM